tara:strand:- start:272 stop:817 length:546 start_codon:yes stop_codon:yes gene_type:complete
MKKIITKNLLVALLLGMLTNSMVGNNFGNMNRKTPLIFIKNTTGKIIYEKSGNIHNNNMEDIDFSYLKNGYYTLEINKDFQIELKPFTVISGKAIFHPKAEKTIFKPVIRSNKNKILISKLNFEAYSMKVVIYYEDELILSDVIEGEKLIQKIYRLHKNKKGDYKIVAKVNDRTYTRKISL